MCYRYVFLISILTFLFGISSGFSEEKFPFYPSSQQNISPEEFDLQTTVKRQAESIKREFFGLLYSCQSVRENSFSYCDKDKNPPECKKEAKIILEIWSLAEGKCDKVVNYSPKLCTAIKDQNCSTLGSLTEANICKAFIDRDAKLLYKAEKNKFESVVSAENAINIYYGFKYYSLTACDRVRPFKEGGFFIQKMMCRILFSPEDPQKLIDNIVLDLSYLQYVKEIKKDPSACQNIKDSIVKQACYDSGINDFITFFID